MFFKLCPILNLCYFWVVFFLQFIQKVFYILPTFCFNVFSLFGYFSITTQKECHISDKTTDKTVKQSHQVLTTNSFLASLRLSSELLSRFCDISSESCVISSPTKMSSMSTSILGSLWPCSALTMSRASLAVSSDSALLSWSMYNRARIHKET